MKYIDLNSDLGESFGNYSLGKDEKVLDFVTSANIACGFHAGDPLVMDKTVKMALEKNVAIGAHPGYPDLLGFGRRNMQISPGEAEAYIIYQVGALKGFVKAYGGKMQHVKPHGAFYNMAAQDYALALAIAKGVKKVDKDLILVGLAGSQLIKAAQDVGIRSKNEVFADRAYTSQGTLVPRGTPGALIKDSQVAVERIFKMLTENVVQALDGTEIPIQADTICVHGDSDEALEFVKMIKEQLAGKGIMVKSFS